MADKLSIVGPNDITLDTTHSDRVASFLKAVAGAAPVIGSMLSEVLAVTIPNQKQDRVIAFLKVLSDKVKYIEEDVLREKMHSDAFTNLLEDAVHHASRSVTPERRVYLASLLKNALTKSELDAIGQKELLELLSSLNDAEIIVLKCESLRTVEERREFVEKHKTLLAERTVQFDEAGERIIDKSTPDDYTRELLRERYLKTVMDEGLLEYNDHHKGTILYNPTPLGKLLLRYIDLAG
jgi:hypothetical protein